MECILVHRRHSTKLASLPFSRTICRYALSSWAAWSRASWHICYGELLLDILIYVWHLYIMSFICSYIIIFGWRGYTNYQMLGNGDIRSLHMLLFQFLSVLFWGTTSRLVGVAYHLSMLCLDLYCFYSCCGCCWIFMDGVSVGEIYTATYMYDWWLGLAGSRHLEYLYVLFACFPPFGAPSLYSDRVVCCPSNRWTLSVFLQKLKIYLDLKKWHFRKINKENRVLFYLLFPKLGPVCHLSW